MKQRHYIKGTHIHEPNNYADLKIQLNYENDDEQEAISVNEWELGVGNLADPMDGFKVAKDHIDSGLNGGVGVAEGAKYELIIDNEKGTNYSIFNGYLNLWDAKYKCGLITAKAVHNGYDRFVRDYDKYTFQYLFDIGVILPTDFIPVPYVINKKQSAFETLMAYVTIYVVAQQLYVQVLALAELASEAANPFEATAIVRIVLQIAYILVLFISLVKLLIDFFNMVVQPVKYHFGMYAVTLIEKGLSELGLTLSSTILQQGPFSKELILPEKYNLPEPSDGILDTVVGYFTADPNEGLGFFKGTIGECIRALQIEFDAKIVIDPVANILYFEKQDFALNTTALYVIPNVEKSEQVGIKNFDEFKSNIEIKFLTDQSDRNTIQQFPGTSVQITTLASAYTDKKLALGKGLLVDTIPFARGMRKTELTFVENLLSNFIDIVNDIITGLVDALNVVIGIVNDIIDTINDIIDALDVIGINLNFQLPGVTPLTAPTINNVFDDRIGMLKMESDFINVPKLIMVDSNSNPRNNILLPTNETHLNAKYLFDNFNYFRSFIGRNGYPGNQYIYYDLEEVPFTFEDYEKVRYNNRIVSFDGVPGKLLSLEWDVEKQTATGRYKLQKQYISSLIERITEPNGE